MARPKPLHDGDLAHLTPGTVRHDFARVIRIVAIQGYDVSAGPNAQYVALLAGDDVVLTREQIKGGLPPEMWPANVDDHAAWTLSGSNTLAPS